MNAPFSEARAPPTRTRAPSLTPSSTQPRILESWRSLIWAPIWVDMSVGSPTLIFLKASVSSPTNLS